MVQSAHYATVEGSTIDRNIKPGDLEAVKVTIVNMPLRETALPNTPPEGPARLAACLRDYGAIPTLVDLNAYRIQDGEAQKRGLPDGRHLTLAEVRDLLSKHFDQYGDQHVVGFSGLITTLTWQEQVAKIVRELQPDTFLVSGNGLATELKAVLFDWIPELDAVATGEGDYMILKIAHDAKMIREMGFKQAHAAGKLDPYYVGEIGSRHRFFYTAAPIQNLDDLPLPAWDLLAEDVNGFQPLEYYIGNSVWGAGANNSSAAPFRMKRSMTTVSSRGCPFACKFCFRGQQGGRDWRVISAGKLAQLVEAYMQAYGIDFMGFPDDNFAIDEKRIAALVPALGPLGMRWGTHLRLDESADLRPSLSKPDEFILADPRRVDLMAQAGCVYIGFGAESANATVLESMGKGGFILKNGMVSDNGYSFPRTMTEGIKAALQAGIHANCTWITGWPGETLEQTQTSVAFMKWQQELYAQGLRSGTSEHEAAVSSVNTNMFVATPYPGAELFLHPVVREKLTDVFGIHFERGTYRPIWDANMRRFVGELDDATKVLCDPRSERPLNFSALPDDQYLTMMKLIEQGETLKILDM